MNAELERTWSLQGWTAWWTVLYLFLKDIFQHWRWYSFPGSSIPVPHYPFRDKYFQMPKRNSWDKNKCTYAVWPVVVHGLASSKAAGNLKTPNKYSSVQIPLGKISGHNNCKDVKCVPCLSLHFSIGAAENHNAKSKKIAISSSIICVVWNLSSGRRQASSSSCCQCHRVTLAPSFTLCFVSPCVRAVAVVSHQWPLPKVPSPFGTWSYLALPSCHQDILSGCRSRTYIT